jgi:chromosome segregation ATPase
MNTEDRLYLKKITLSGFKSFGRESQEISFGDVTLLIGPNGIGKSNYKQIIKKEQ